MKERKNDVWEMMVDGDRFSQFSVREKDENEILMINLPLS